MESLKKIFRKDQLLTAVLLLLLIAAGETACHYAGLPAWPLFACMVAFFLAELKTHEIPKIIVGAVTGEFAMWLLAVVWLPSVSGAIGSFPAQLIFVLIFVGCIVLFGPVLPWFLNSFTFLFFLISTLGAPFSPFVWMAISGLGGTVIILGCVLIHRLAAACAPSAAP